MILNEYLKNRLYTYSITRLGMRDYRRGWLKGDCPICGKEDKFGIHIGDNKSHCFSCESRHNLFTLVDIVEGLGGFQEVLKFIRVFEGLEYKEVKVQERLIKDVILPESFTLLNQGDSLIARSARKYIKGRGFDIDKLSFKGFGYCTKGRYQGCIILPYYIKGKLVYFTSRRFMGTGPKYDNPTIDDVGIGKSQIIYNVDALYMYNKIFLLEGIFNAETMGDNAICMGGKSISSLQYFYILRSPVDKLVFILDPDAILQAIQLAMDIIHYKKVKVVMLPHPKDANDLGYKKTMEIVHKTRWADYNYLIRLKNSL